MSSVQFWNKSQKLCLWKKTVAMSIIINNSNTCDTTMQAPPGFHIESDMTDIISHLEDPVDLNL